MHENCRLLFEQYAREHFTPGKRILEIGPEAEESAFKKLVGWESLLWETVDIRLTGHRLTHLAPNEYSFPIPDNCYDIVLSANVLEHVRKIWVWIREVARVCKGGGLVITINPVSWPYHEAPYDCWRAYPEGMRALYEDAGLSVIHSVFDSLESPGYKRYLPGRSMERLSWKGRAAYRVLGVLGMPVERSYDTITIGEKKPPGFEKGKATSGIAGSA